MVVWVFGNFGRMEYGHRDIWKGKESGIRPVLPTLMVVWIGLDYMDHSCILHLKVWHSPNRLIDMIRLDNKSSRTPKLSAIPRLPSKPTSLILTYGLTTELPTRLEIFHGANNPFSTFSVKTYSHVLSRSLAIDKSDSKVPVSRAPISA